MLVQIPQLLSADQVAHIRGQLAATNWVDGKATAGSQSAGPKNNLQVPEDAPAARALGEIIQGMEFGTHIDNAIRFVKPSLGSAAPIRVRTDLSATLFLTDPQDYDGGELVIEDTFGSHAVKLAAGDLVLYSATSRHHVTPVTRGSRWSSFFWIQSMVQDETARTMLFELDTAIQGLRKQIGDSEQVVNLTGLYHNLVRRWAQA
jgi:PKHD-type hydroxylase